MPYTTAFAFVTSIRCSRRTVAAVLASLAMALSGCASGPKTYEIRGDGDPVLNRDVGGKSLSVVVRVYQFKDAVEFTKLTFDMLTSGRTENELFGQELIGRAEAIVVPGGKYVSTEKLQPEARYVGVVALFRRPDPHYWRFLIDADRVRSEGLGFKVQDCYLSLTNVKPLPIPGQPLDARPDCAAPSAPAQRQGAQSGPSSPQPAKTQPQAKRSWMPKIQTPDINVGVPNSAVPATVNVGGGGVKSINVGSAPAAPASAAPVPAR